MTKLFDDMTFNEKLDHIEKCQKEALECIRRGDPSNLADIADHVDLWGPWMLQALRAKPTGETSDGYHTFNELYEHRCLLFINLCLACKDQAYWRPHYEGWPLVGLRVGDKQITYHVAEKYLPLFESKIIQGGPDWDGHTSNDVVEILKTTPFRAKPIALVPDQHEIDDYISSHVPMPWPTYNVEEINQVGRDRTSMQSAIMWALSRIGRGDPMTELERYKAAYEVLRKAVQMYAEQRLYGCETGDEGRIPIISDYGTKARAALKEAEDLLG